MIVRQPHGPITDLKCDLAGIWIENTEGSKFRLKVFNDLKIRGVDDVLIAVTDWLKGAPAFRPPGDGNSNPSCSRTTCVCNVIGDLRYSHRWSPLRIP